MTQARDWSASVSTRVARAVRDARARKGLSALALSDRTAELGHRVGRARISDLESGRRSRVEVAELLILARALETVPLRLLYPDLPNGAVEALPATNTSSWSAAKWFGGEDTLQAEVEVDGVVEVTVADGTSHQIADSPTRGLYLLRVHDDLVARCLRVRENATEEPSGSSEGGTEAELRTIRMEMAARGFDRPALPRDLADLEDPALPGRLWDWRRNVVDWGGID